MRILFIGDIVGKSGRDVVVRYVPKLREKYKLDVVIANAENAAHGFGLTPKLLSQLKQCGIDIVTMGNHTFDKKDILEVIDTDEKIVRPDNYPDHTPGHSVIIHTTENSKKIAVIQFIGTIFMRNTLSPFKALEKFFAAHKLGKDYHALVVDIHAEATSEKNGMAYFCDGKASLVAGTHTHIPTADARILPKGVGFITDVGMCGDYDSIIGMQIETAMPRFMEQPYQQLKPAEGEGTLCAVYAETDDSTGRCTLIRPIRLGAHLQNTEDI